MATQQDMLQALDAFMVAPKRVAAASQPFQWRQGYSPHEVLVQLPLEVSGEGSDAKLQVVGFPRASFLKFRLSLCFNAAICRLDYTDEFHPNAHCVDADGVPPAVNGPHYHSWPLNRRFFRGASAAPKLHNAATFAMSARFDSILRWFCEDTRIEALPYDHVIALPTSDTML